MAEALVYAHRLRRPLVYCGSLLCCRPAGHVPRTSKRIPKRATRYRLGTPPYGIATALGAREGGVPRRDAVVERVCRGRLVASGLRVRSVTSRLRSTEEARDTALP